MAWFLVPLRRAADLLDVDGRGRVARRDSGREVSGVRAIYTLDEPGRERLR